MQENKFENLNNQKEEIDAENIKSCLENSLLSAEEIKQVSNFVLELKDALKKYNCNIESVIFFGSAATENKDSYSDVDFVILFKGNLPNKDERNKLYKIESGKVINSMNGVCSLAAGTEFSEDMVLFQNMHYHIDFRKKEILDKIFKELNEGNCDSFYFVHCLQNGLFAGGNSLIDGYKNFLDRIPIKAKENFLNFKKREIVKVLDSMTKAVIRDDSVRYLELLLKNIYNTIDYYYVTNDKYPGKKKGLKEKLDNFPEGDRIYSIFFESLKNALEDPHKSFDDFRRIASQITSTNFSYIENQ